MSERSESYRRLAEQAGLRAAKAMDWQAKNSFQELAQSWRELADQCERHELRSAQARRFLPATVLSCGEEPAK